MRDGITNRGTFLFRTICGNKSMATFQRMPIYFMGVAPTILAVETVAFTCSQFSNRSKCASKQQNPHPLINTASSMAKTLDTIRYYKIHYLMWLLGDSATVFSLV